MCCIAAGDRKQLSTTAVSHGSHIWAYGLLYLAIGCLHGIHGPAVHPTGRHCRNRKVAYDLRRSAFAKLQELSFSYYDHRPVGWMIGAFDQRLRSDFIDVCRGRCWTWVWGGLLLSGITIMMFWMNWRLALVVLCIVPPLSVVTTIYQKKS